MTRISRLFAPTLLLIAGPAFGQSIEPGMWSGVATVVAAEMPGMPPEMAQSMTGQVLETSNTCITPEQAADPQSLIDPDSECTFDTFRMENGQMEIAGACPAPGGQGDATMTASGTYSATSYSMTSRVEVPTPAGAMMFELNQEGERTGDC